MHAVKGHASTDPDKISLREARAADADEVTRLWRELMDLHVDVDERFALADNSNEAFLTYFEAALSRDDYRVRVAVMDDALVGFTVACILPNSPVYRTRWIGYINDVCVTESMRGRGVGKRLAYDAIRWLKDNGADSVEVYVARKNHLAQRFWRRIGGRDYLDRLSIELPEDD